MTYSKFQKLGRKWRKMSKKLKATFSRPASEKETKPKKEPRESPSQKSVDRIIADHAVEEPMKKVESNKRSSDSILAASTKTSTEGIVKAEIELEQGVDVDQIHFTEKNSSHHVSKKTKKNPRIVFKLSPTH